MFFRTWLMITVCLDERGRMEEKQDKGVLLGTSAEDTEEALGFHRFCLVLRTMRRSFSRLQMTVVTHIAQCIKYRKD